MSDAEKPPVMDYEGEPTRRRSEWKSWMPLGCALMQLLWSWPAALFVTMSRMTYRVDWRLDGPLSALVFLPAIAAVVVGCIALRRPWGCRRRVRVYTGLLLGIAMLCLGVYGTWQDFRSHPSGSVWEAL